MIRYELKGNVAYLTMENAPLNVFSIDMLSVLNRLLDEIATENKANVVVLRSALPKGFSAGVSVADHVPEKVNQMLTSFHRAIRLLDRWNRVTVAQVHGICLGGAAELAFSCDFVVAAEGTEFGLPEIDLACFPPVAAAVLPNRIGWQLACEYILTGRRFSAAEAAQHGLVNRVAPLAELDKITGDYAQALSLKSASVLKLTRRAMRESRDVPFAQALWTCEEIYREQLLQTQDCQEGIKAFLEKRKPTWTNK